MKRIESFCVNHDKLKPGMYVSRIDGDAVTYDIRMVVPNARVYLENDGLHTFEHLFATYVRNSADSDNIIYVGPMGCRTGFYFITRDCVSKARHRAGAGNLRIYQNLRGRDSWFYPHRVRQLSRPQPAQGKGLCPAACPDA